MRGIDVAKPRRDMDAIDLAAWVGRTAYRTPGAIYMPELEIAYLIRCMHRESTGYDDNPKAKLRRHVMLIGPPDTTKSQCVEDFFKEFANCVHYSKLDSTQRAMPKSKPTFTNLNGGTTWEAMRGGCNDGVIYKPQLHDCDFLYASELFSFLGHTPAQMLHKVDQFNPALQEGWVEVNLAKMKGLPKKVKEAFAEEIEYEIDEGIIEYSPDDGIMRYHCNAAFIGCTRFLTQEQEERLKPTGFLSRLSIAEWSPDQDELRQYFDSQFGARDEEAAARLADFNQYAWVADYDWVNYPPKVMVENIITRFNTIYWRVAQRTGHSFQEIRPGRDVQNVSQLLTAVALVRELKKQKDAGVPVAKIDGLEYTWTDVQRVLDLKEQQMDMLIRRKEDQAKSGGMLDRAVPALVSFVKSKASEVGKDQATESLEEVQGGEFIRFCMSKCGISRGTAYKWRGALRDSAYLYSRGMANGERGSDTILFAVSPTVMEDLGYKPSLLAQQEQLDAMRRAGVFEITDEESSELEALEESRIPETMSIEEAYEEYYSAGDGEKEEDI